PSGSGCCSLDDFLDARRVASRLNIPYYVMDFRDTFKRSVVDPFVEEYHRGRTPNPCALCNQSVKFAGFWERARELGAEWLATGHYARVVRQSGRAAQLWAAKDSAKDQSYFLFGMDRAVLERSLFPVGDLPKAVVREHAKRFDLSVADKPESQEICFAPKGDYAGFVERYGLQKRAAAGVVVDEDGHVLGPHDGVHRFTVGQRRGLGISSPDPLYVTKIDAATGQVQVGSRSKTIASGLVATRVNWLQPSLPELGRPLRVKIRSRFAPADVVVERASSEEFAVSAQGGLAAVTPGQAAVLYDGERVVGGGWIERALH
ncbi:MAG TPA: tRNA 2-thiouridine(34) synthase MnmA, partial [Candidatus Acidoferrales bacterium]|nr:tRNA 2-thiouridine(34) synthase MnmA [Candidatus Acidoferrales bacterium]